MHSLLDRRIATAMIALLLWAMAPFNLMQATAAATPAAPACHAVHKTTSHAAASLLPTVPDCCADATMISAPGCQSCSTGCLCTLTPGEMAPIERGWRQQLHRLHPQRPQAGLLPEPGDRPPRA